MKNVMYLNRLAVENQNAMAGDGSESKNVNRGTILCSSAHRDRKSLGRFSAAVIWAAIGLVCLSGCETITGEADQKLIQEKVPICVENCDARGLKELRDQYGDKRLWWEDKYTRHGFCWWAFHNAFVSACLKKVDVYVNQKDYAGFEKFSDAFGSDIGVIETKGMEELKAKMESASMYLGEIGRKARLAAQEKLKKEEAATKLANEKAENEERVNWMIEYIFGKGKTSNLPTFCGFQLGGSRYDYSDSQVVGWSGQLEKPFRHFREYQVSENDGGL